MEVALLTILSTVSIAGGLSMSLLAASRRKRLIGLGLALSGVLLGTWLWATQLNGMELTLLTIGLS